MKTTSVLLLCVLAVACHSTAHAQAGFQAGAGLDLSDQHAATSIDSESSETGSSRTLQGGVELKRNTWSLEAAKKEALNGALATLDTSGFPASDPDRAENLKAIIHKQRIAHERLITLLPHGIYSVTHKCSKEMFYYLPDGSLFNVEEMTSTSFATPSCMPFYPNKAYKYSVRTGKLVAVSIKVGMHEIFTFWPNGELMTHWKYDNCYLKDGRSCGTRKTFLD